MKFSKELQIGLITLIAASLLYVGFNFLKGSNLFSRSNTYYARFSSVAGLQISSSVLHKGLNVGLVKDIEFDNARNLVVTFTLQKDIPFCKTGRIAMRASGVFGDKKLELIQDAYSGECYIPGDTLIGVIEEDAIKELQKKMAPVMEHVESTIIYLKNFLAYANRASTSIDLMLKNTNRLMDGSATLIEANQNTIKTITNNLATLSKDLLTLERMLKPSLANLDTFSTNLSRSDIAGTLDQTKKTVSELQTTLDGINKGQGTLGQLAKNDSLYRNLNSSMQSLDKLLINLREEPKRYLHFSVFGKKNTPPKE